MSALPWEIWTPEIVSFQSCCIPCLENDTVFGTCCRCRLLLGRKSVHCSVASQFAERSRLRAWAMRRSATSLLNACCVVGQRSPRRRWWCPLLSQNWAALSCSSSSRRWKWIADITATFRWRSRCCQSCVALPVTRTCFSRTAHRARKTVQLLQQETPQFISPICGPLTVGPKPDQLPDLELDARARVQDARPRHQRLEAAPRWLKRQFLGFIFPQVLQRH